jgi:hypothetical protein
MDSILYTREQPFPFFFLGTLNMVSHAYTHHHLISKPNSPSVKNVNLALLMARLFRAKAIDLQSGVMGEIRMGAESVR